MILEPIFEADLPPEQHAYRANHSAWRRCKKCIACWARGIVRWSMRI